MTRFAPAVVSCVLVLSVSSCARFCGENRPLRDIATDARPFAWPQGKRAAVSLTFDDARPSQVDVGMDILNRHGVKATFYVSPNRVKERLPQWRQAVAAGHEIGNHSVRHACTGNFTWSRDKALEDYTLSEMAAELDEASVAIEDLLQVLPATFAYPCGQKFIGRGRNTRSYVPLVAERFLAGRGWRDEGANDPAFCDLAQLMTLEFDGLTVDDIVALLDKAAADGSWLVLCGHEVGAEGRQTTRAATLAALCDYADDPENGLWVDTVANVAQYVADRRRSAGLSPR